MEDEFAERRRASGSFFQNCRDVNSNVTKLKYKMALSGGRVADRLRHGELSDSDWRTFHNYKKKSVELSQKKKCFRKGFFLMRNG